MNNINHNYLSISKYIYIIYLYIYLCTYTDFADVSSTENGSRYRTVAQKTNTVEPITVTGRLGGYRNIHIYVDVEMFEYIFIYASACVFTLFILLIIPLFFI